MIDSHCHIDEQAYDADRDELLRRQQQDGVEAIVIPGVNVQSIEAIFAVCRRWPGYCYPVLGLHPQDVAEDWQEQLDVLHEAMIAHTQPALPVSERIVAIGEIGLDYHYTRDFVEAQHETFRRQLRWANALDLPVIIHSRDATADCLRIVSEEIEYAKSMKGQWPIGICSGVIHCYNGSVEVAQQWLDMGLHLGIGGVLTFKNCRLAETLEHVPLDRLLLETDGPYLAPTPFRGQRNEPRYIRLVAERLAQVYRCDAEEVIRVTSENSRRLFRLSPR